MSHDQPSCADCRFARPTRRKHKNGSFVECHVAGPRSNQSEPWPVVRSKDWCGFFELDTEPAEAVAS